MEVVDNKINKGLLKVKDLIVTYSKKLDPAADTHKAENAYVVCPSIGKFANWRCHPQ